MGYKSGSKAYRYHYGGKRFPQPHNTEIEHLMEGGYNMPTRVLITSKEEVSGSSLHKKKEIKVKFHNNKLNRVGIHNVRINKMLRK